jgi:hypothetical protein
VFAMMTIALFRQIKRCDREDLLLRIHSIVIASIHEISAFLRHLITRRFICIYEDGTPAQSNCFLPKRKCALCGRSHTILTQFAHNIPQQIIVEWEGRLINFG